MLTGSPRVEVHQLRGSVLRRSGNFVTACTMLRTLCSSQHTWMSHSVFGALKLTSTGKKVPGSVAGTTNSAAPLRLEASMRSMLHTSWLCRES